MEYKANRRVEASARTFFIVEHLSAVDAAGVSTLADELDMSKGIVHNHLSTLRELGYVRKVGSDYQLSAKLLRVGLDARSNARLYTYGHKLCREFATQLDTAVVLCQHTERECAVIDANRVPSSLEVRVGSTLPMAGSLPGVVIQLATHPENEEIESVTEYDIAQLRTSFETGGYTTGPLSASRETDCVAVPILDDEDVCHGAIGVLLTDGQRDQRLQRLTEATIALRGRIEDRFDSEWTGERSFATEKHSWVG